MPRIAEPRRPATPNSPLQEERRSRILRAAARLGTQHDYERVQMQDVAGQAGVAIATLYRYFPSKVHLFTAVLKSGVLALDDPPATNGRTGSDAVRDLLVGLCHRMAEQRRLSLSLIQANNQAQSLEGSDSPVIDASFEQLVLRTAGITEPTEDEHRRARLVMQCWFGVLMSVLNGRSSLAEGAADIARACELLLAD